jgi:hypothetical protein
MYHTKIALGLRCVMWGSGCRPFLQSVIWNHSVTSQLGGDSRGMDPRGSPSEIGRAHV